VRTAYDISEELKNAKAKVFDNLDPNVQDRLKHYEEESGQVLNKFERLLLSVTRHQLLNFADFSGDGKTFTLNKSPVHGAPTGKYYFKSQPIDHAHQYRYASPLAQHVISGATSLSTPQKHLTFSLKESERVPSAVKSLLDQRGKLIVKKITFGMKAKHDDVSESYILAHAITDSGKNLDSEYVADILSLKVVSESPTEAFDESVFEAHLDSQRTELEKEVQVRNSKYYDQQEEIVYRNNLDQKAASEAKIREFRKKEKDARLKARQETDPLKQLEYKKEARKWEQRAEEEDDRARDERREASRKAEEYLELIEESLKGNQKIEDIFSVSWEIVR
jgi:hypothetical protein